MRERDIERYFCVLVKWLGGTAEKFKSPGKPNVPDRLVLLPHSIYRERGLQAIFVELKAPGKKPTKAQLRDHRRRRALGFRVDVLDSYEAVDEWGYSL